MKTVDRISSLLALLHPLCAPHAQYDAGLQFPQHSFSNLCTMVEPNVSYFLHGEGCYACMWHPVTLIILDLRPVNPLSIGESTGFFHAPKSTNLSSRGYFGWGNIL